MKRRVDDAEKAEFAKRYMTIQMGAGVLPFILFLMSYAEAVKLATQQGGLQLSAIFTGAMIALFFVLRMLLNYPGLLKSRLESEDVARDMLRSIWYRTVVWLMLYNVLSAIMLMTLDKPSLFQMVSVSIVHLTVLMLAARDWIGYDKAVALLDDTKE